MILLSKRQNGVVMGTRPTSSMTQLIFRTCCKCICLLIQTDPERALHVQDYLDDLCASYGSVITLAYYIAVPENATDPAAVISADIDVIRQKFDQ
jgi:hypothetical protein